LVFTRLRYVVVPGACSFTGGGTWADSGGRFGPKVTLRCGCGDGGSLESDFEQCFVWSQFSSSAISGETLRLAACGSSVADLVVYRRLLYFVVLAKWLVSACFSNARGSTFGVLAAHCEDSKAKFLLYGEFEAFPDCHVLAPAVLSRLAGASTAWVQFRVVYGFTSSQDRGSISRFFCRSIFCGKW
ncbi:unnamed protein product, partial [Brassica oleracea var. botrytis]